jgi:hypothetical protein
MSRRRQPWAAIEPLEDAISVCSEVRVWQRFGTKWAVLLNTTVSATYYNSYNADQDNVIRPPR